MSVRKALLPVLDRIRTDVLGPSGVDLRSTTVTIVTRYWTGGLRGSGVPIDTGGGRMVPAPLVLTPAKVRHVTTREIASSGGRFEEGDVIVGPITPAYTTDSGSSGGYTEAQLRPTVEEQGIEVIYRLASQPGDASGVTGDYQMIEFKRDRSMHFLMVLGRERPS